jgi:hypothetical protein
MKLRYIRVGDTPYDDDEVVVRGGDIDPEIVRTDAQRMFDIYGIYGISVFALHGATLDELAQQPPLVRFSRLTITTVGAIRGAGLDLQPTGRNPRHYTVVLPDLDPGVDGLCGCDRTLWVNPYHEE